MHIEKGDCSSSRSEHARFEKKKIIDCVSKNIFFGGLRLYHRDIFGEPLKFLLSHTFFYLIAIFQINTYHFTFQFSTELILMEWKSCDVKANY